MIKYALLILTVVMCISSQQLPSNVTYGNKEKIQKSKTLVSIGILQTKAQEDLFKILVGDKYKAFLNSSEIQFETDDLDNMNLHGFASGVNGLYTLMENIILYNEKDEFWCAVIDNEKVYYFTNSSNFTKTLPKTIESWRKNFHEKEVIFNAR